MPILSRKSIHSERNCSTVNIPFLECMTEIFLKFFTRRKLTDVLRDSHFQIFRKIFCVLKDNLQE